MTIIGREAPAEIVIPVPQVSARHAEIVHVGDDVYLLTDLGSSNGTFVNGQRVQQARVRLGDDVRLGSFRVNLALFRNLVPLSAGSGQGPVFSSPPTSPAEWRPADAGGPAPAPVLKAAAPAPTPPAPVAQPSAPAPAPQPAARVAQVGQPGLGTELAVALAAQKSFTGQAFFVWFLYWLFWIPGFVMNIVYMNEASSVKKITGVSPSGSGCLTFLFFVHVLLPLIVVVLILVTGGSLLHSLTGIFR